MSVYSFRIPPMPMIEKDCCNFQVLCIADLILLQLIYGPKFFIPVDVARIIYYLCFSHSVLIPVFTLLPSVSLVSTTNNENTNLYITFRNWYFMNNPIFRNTTSLTLLGTVLRGTYLLTS